MTRNEGEAIMEGKRSQGPEPAVEVEFDLDACHRAHCDCAFRLEDVDEEELLARADEEQPAKT